MLQFLHFWYRYSLPWTFATYQRTVRTLEGTFAIRDTARNLAKPIFQDYSYQGRIIGFFLRLGRILLGLIFYCLVSLLYIAAYILWLFLPFLFITSMVGAFLASPLSTVPVTPLP